MPRQMIATKTKEKPKIGTNKDKIFIETNLKKEDRISINQKNSYVGKNEESINNKIEKRIG
jgi:hypothetical protein